MMMKISYKQWIVVLMFLLQNDAKRIHIVRVHGKLLEFRWTLWIIYGVAATLLIKLPKALVTDICLAI